MRIPLPVWQLIPILVVLLPFFESVAFALLWRHSLAHPWLYGLAGVVVAYAIAIGAVFVAEKYSEKDGRVAGGYFLETPETKKLPTTKLDKEPLSFEPLTLAWTGLLAFILVASGFALWGLRPLFAKAGP